MGVVVVKTRAIAQHEVAFNFDKTEFARGVLGVIVRLVGVLAQLVNPETAHIHMGVLAVVIPAHPDARLGGAAHQRDRFGNDIDLAFGIAGYTNLGLQAELDGRRNHFQLWE